MPIISRHGHVSFISDHHYVHDASLNSFTWKGNANFFVPPNDQIAQLHLDFDWGGHGEVNRTVQFFWTNPGDEGHGPAGDYIVTLTFAPNGRWLEDFSAADFDLNGNLIGWPGPGNPVPTWDVAYEGGHHLHVWTENVSLPPQDEILAEGAWAPHHHDGWLLT